MCLMRLINWSYEDEDDTMRFGRLEKLECITSGALSDGMFLSLGTIPLAMGRTIDRKGC